MRHLIVVAGLSLAILAGSVAGSVGEVAAATDDRYDYTATHQEGLTVYAPGLTKEGAQTFKETWKAEGFEVKCKKM